MGENQADPIDDKALELAVLVRPDVGMPAGPQEIWDHVVENDARLPGHWDCSLHGAIEAARNGDIAVCAYLSARCFKDAGDEQLGAQALAALDENARSYLWLTGVEPIVVNVPAGLERLEVLLEGKETPQWIPSEKLMLCSNSQENVEVKGKKLFGKLAAGANRSAEHFNAGETVELSHLESGAHRNRSRPRSALRAHVPGASNSHSRAGEGLRRLCLDKRQLLDMRRLLPQAELSEDASATMLPLPWSIPGMPAEALRSARVPGGLFHVLAYPLARDFSKVLLRPAARTAISSGTLRTTGETLVAQCAKAGHWDLVETLLSAGVPCPNLADEFADICGNWPPVRRRWSRDLAAAAGPPRHTMLGLASRAAGDGPLRCMLQALQKQGRQQLLQEIDGGQQPFLMALAEASRWELVRAVLDELCGGDGPGSLSLASFAESHWLSQAPPDVADEIQIHTEKEKVSGLRSRSLKEYFERQLRGEVMSEALAPVNFELVDQAFKGSRPESKVAVLDRAVKLRDAVFGEDSEVAFVSILPMELEEAQNAVADPDCAMLPVSLSGKKARQRDPTAGSGDGDWLAVLCPSSYLVRDTSGELGVHIPAGRFPTPYVPRTTARVHVVTLCCSRPLEGVLVHVNGRRAGTTGRDGSLELALPAGAHEVSAVGSNKQVVKVKKAGSIEDVKLALNGELFLYLQPPPPCEDEEEEEEEEEEEVSIHDAKPPEKHGVMLTTRKDAIPMEAIPITRIDRMLKPRNWSATRRKGGHNAIFNFGAGQECSATMALYKMQAHLGMYATSKIMMVKKLLLTFVSSANESCLRATLFYAWMTCVRQSNAHNTCGSHKKTKVSYHINLDAPVWVGKSEVQDECLAELLYQTPLKLGDVVSDNHAEVQRTLSERSRSRSSVSRDGMGDEIDEFCRSLTRSLSGSRLTLTAPPDPPASRVERTGSNHGERMIRQNSTTTSGSWRTSRPSSANSTARGLRVARGVYSARSGVGCCGVVGLPGHVAQRPPLRRPPSRQLMQQIPRMVPQSHRRPRSLSREPSGKPMYFDPYEVDFFYA